MYGIDGLVEEFDDLDYFLNYLVGNSDTVDGRLPLQYSKQRIHDYFKFDVLLMKYFATVFSHLALYIIVKLRPLSLHVYVRIITYVVI